MSTEIAKKPPTFTELMSNKEEAFKNDELNFLLNHAPHPTWIKKHPLAKMKDSEGREVPLDYLPIDKVEYLLTKIFKRWRVEVLEVQQLFNAVQVTVRLHYWNHYIEPATWEYHDGVGAVSVQVDKGVKAFDLTAIKANAVQIAVPAAKSYAIKDAAENIGALFGKDLGRQATLNFAMTYKPEQQNLSGETVFTSFNDECKAKIKSFNDADELLSWSAEQTELHDDKLFQAAVFARKAQLQKQNI